MLGLTVELVEVRRVPDLGATLASAKCRAGALLVSPDGAITANRKLVIDSAAANGLVAIYPGRSFVEEGGLMSYGVTPAGQRRQGAPIIGRLELEISRVQGLVAPTGSTRRDLTVPLDGAFRVAV